MTVYLVEDQATSRANLQAILEASGHQVKSFASAEHFLSDFDPDDARCLIVDYKLPQMSGIDLVKAIRSYGSITPFVVTTGFGNIASTVEFMKLGAVTVLEKPVDLDELLRFVNWAVRLEDNERSMMAAQTAITSRMTRLTAREKEILDRLLIGKSTRQLAQEFSIATKTIEVHRSNIVKKMEVDSISELLVLMLFDSNAFRRVRQGMEVRSEKDPG